MWCPCIYLFYKGMVPNKHSTNSICAAQWVSQHSLSFSMWTFLAVSTIIPLQIKITSTFKQKLKILEFKYFWHSHFIFGKYLRGIQSIPQQTLQTTVWLHNWKFKALFFPFSKTENKKGDSITWMSIFNWSIFHLFVCRKCYYSIHANLKCLEGSAC